MKNNLCSDIPADHEKQPHCGNPLTEQSVINLTEEEALSVIEQLKTTRHPEIKRDGLVLAFHFPENYKIPDDILKDILNNLNYPV